MEGFLLVLFFLVGMYIGIVLGFLDGSKWWFGE